MLSMVPHNKTETKLTVVWGKTYGVPAPQNEGQPATVYTKVKVRVVEEVELLETKEITTNIYEVELDNQSASEAKILSMFRNAKNFFTQIQ